MHAFLTANCQQTTNADTLHIYPDKSIGIDEIRQLQHFLSRKPTGSDHNTVIIHDAHLLTIPAQQAILKTLEEPPGNSLIYLVTPYPDSLIPTVLSRVQIVNQPNPTDFPNNPEIPKLLSAKVGDRLTFLDSQGFTRESFSVFLDQFERYIHADVAKLHYLYPPVLQSRKYLKANCNLKLIIDNFALNLPA